MWTFSEKEDVSQILHVLGGNHKQSDLQNFEHNKIFLG